MRPISQKRIMRNLNVTFTKFCHVRTKGRVQVLWFVPSVAYRTTAAIRIATKYWIGFGCFQ